MQCVLCAKTGNVGTEGRDWEDRMSASPCEAETEKGTPSGRNGVSKAEGVREPAMQGTKPGHSRS